MQTVFSRGNYNLQEMSVYCLEKKNKKNIINLSCAEFAKSLLKVKLPKHRNQYTPNQTDYTIAP